MDKVLTNAILNFEITFVLYQNSFNNEVVIFPKSDEILKSEENILYILQYIYDEIYIYCTIIKSKTGEDNFFEKFKIHSYLSSLNSINFPISKKVYELLQKILNLTNSLKENV